MNNEEISKDQANEFVAQLIEKMMARGALVPFFFEPLTDTLQVGSARVTVTGAPIDQVMEWAIRQALPGTIVEDFGFVSGWDWTKLSKMNPLMKQLCYRPTLIKRMKVQVSREAKTFRFGVSVAYAFSEVEGVVSIPELSTTTTPSSALFVALWDLVLGAPQAIANVVHKKRRLPYNCQYLIGFMEEFLSRDMTAQQLQYHEQCSDICGLYHSTEEERMQYVGSQDKRVSHAMVNCVFGDGTELEPMLTTTPKYEDVEFEEYDSTGITDPKSRLYQLVDREGWKPPVFEE